MQPPNANAITECPRNTVEPLTCCASTACAFACSNSAVRSSSSAFRSSSSAFRFSRSNCRCVCSAFRASCSARRSSASASSCSRSLATSACAVRKKLIDHQSHPSAKADSTVPTLISVFSSGPGSGSMVYGKLSCETLTMIGSAGVRLLSRRLSTLYPDPDRLQPRAVFASKKASISCLPETIA